MLSFLVAVKVHVSRPPISMTPVCVAPLIRAPSARATLGLNAVTMARRTKNAIGVSLVLKFRVLALCIAPPLFAAAVPPVSHAIAAGRTPDGMRLRAFPQMAHQASSQVYEMSG